MSLTLTSSAFQHEGMIPEQHAKDGRNLSPPLAWHGVPEGTKSLALVADDPDAPSGLFTHWLIYGIPPRTTELAEGLPPARTLPDGSRQGRNGFGSLGYSGPRPPSGTHRYVFHLYALDDELALPSGEGREDFDAAIRGHVIEEARLLGRYEYRQGRTHGA